MGGWKLEIAKMALYITFPVGLFHYFNQPELFEDWVIKTKRELYPPEDPVMTQNFKNAIRKIQEKQELEMIKKLEASTN